jgi:hypothetical protein
MNSPDDIRSRQRAKVRRTVAILVVLAFASYALFLYTATRGGS